MNSKIAKVTPSNNLAESNVSITKLKKYGLLIELNENTYIWK